MRMAFLYLLVAVAVLPVTVLAVGSCVETSMSIYITAEGQIRGSFVGLEHAQASEILTSCGMKCGCINDIFLCCSDIECIQMERTCNTEDGTNDIPNETIKFASDGHRPVRKRSVLLEKILSGRAAAMRRERRDSERQMTTLEATTVTATPEEETHEGSGSVRKGDQGLRKGKDANLGQSAVKYVRRQRRSAANEKIRFKREEEFMEDAIETTTMESSSDTTGAPEKNNRRKRSSDTLSQNLEREKRSVAGENIRVKREEEFMEDAIETTTMESSSETTDTPDNHGSDRKKRSSDAINLVMNNNENNDRRKRSTGEEMVRVRRDEEEFMEDAVVTTTMSSDSEPTDAPKKDGFHRKKREVLGEILLTTETATTEHTDAEIVYVTDV